MTYQRGDILFNKYQVQNLIGAGSFGEIYLVIHTTLRTQHAIKVLIKGDREIDSVVMSSYRERFRLEARLAANLNHPNIVRVYDFEEQGNQLALIMDYAQGGSLSGKLSRYTSQNTRMPIAEALRLAIDIAQGLTELHRHEIIHRDLKPSNILLDANGRALIADLGVAQTPGGMTTRSTRGEDLPPHPGTPAYMSPEQENMRGYLKPPSDIYSTGIILFEMLTGRNYKHLRTGTRARSLRPEIPAWLDDLVAQMLSQKLEDRPWDGAALFVELSRNKNVSPKPVRKWGVLGAGLIFLAVFIGFMIWGILRQPVHVGGVEALPIITVTKIPPGESMTLLPEKTSAYTLSPTQTLTSMKEATEPVLLGATPEVNEIKEPCSSGQIAFVSNRDGNEEIYLTNIKGSELINLTNNPFSDNSPAWSPDGKKIAFESNRDGNFEIYVMNADGTQQSRITNSNANDQDPNWSPDGRKLVFTSTRNSKYEIWVINSDGTNPTQITNALDKDWAPAWSPNGKWIAFASNDQSQKGEIFIKNLGTGELINLTDNPSHESVPNWSHDGQHIVFYSDRSGNRDLYIMNSDGSGLRQFTEFISDDWLGSWSPDDQCLVFVSGQEGNDEIYISQVNADNTVRLTNSPANDLSPTWSR